MSQLAPPPSTVLRSTGRYRNQLKCIDEEKQDSAASGKCITSLDTMRDVIIISDPIAPSWALQDFDIARRLGRGQFGSVYLARERRSGYLVALKTIRKSQLLQTNNEHLLRREIEIHSHLIHPNILGFYGWFTTSDFICLILELAPQGELMGQLSEGGLPENLASKYLCQMISAIRTCHRYNVIHRDLKPENILVGVDGNLKLADFGWAAHIPDESLANPLPISAARRDADASAQRNPQFVYLKNRRKTYCGTLDYLSPEICKHEWYGKEVDLWCLGILCYELVTGGPPFSHDQYRLKGFNEDAARKQQQLDIQSCDIKSRLLPRMSSDLRDFLLKTLNKDPSERMTTEQMLQHPFISNHNILSEEVDKILEEQTAIRNPTPTPYQYKAPPEQQMQTPAKIAGSGTSIWQQSRLFMSFASSPHSGAALFHTHQ